LTFSKVSIHPSCVAVATGRRANILLAPTGTQWDVVCVCFSVPSAAREHLPIPGHDHAEGPQDDRGGPAGGSHSAGGLHQPAHVHHGRQPDAPDVGAPRAVNQHAHIRLLDMRYLVTHRRALQSVRTPHTTFQSTGVKHEARGPNVTPDGLKDV